MNVSAIIVTRGDVSLDSIIASIPQDWQLVVWNNGEQACWIYDFDHGMRIPWIKEPESDSSVYGRYAAIEHASGDLIYVQDDDCVLSDSQAIVSEWERVEHFNLQHHPGMPYNTHIVCNMPAAFRARHFYDEHSLVGFGACFHRDLPAKAFQRFSDYYGYTPVDLVERVALNDLFLRACDVVFTGLTPRVLVDVPYEDLPWASADNRMWKQPDHQASREQMLERVLKVRDAH